MKALILSDIHSNIVALEAIWNKEKECDFICCTGDLVDWGPYPREAIEWIQAHDVITTQGNHDQWVSINYRRGDIGNRVPLKKRGWEHHNAGCLKEENIRYLEKQSHLISMEFNMD